MFAILAGLKIRGNIIMTSKRFASITHLHIYAIINTIIKYKYTPQGISTIKILDVGCGNGVLLSTLVKELPVRNPGIFFEFYGLDVDDSHVQEKGYFSRTISLLQLAAPTISWENNLKLITSNDGWPFGNDFFDLIFSNQVMEHVFDQELFLKEIRRTMKDYGYSFHLYPLRHYLYEGHLLIPFAHKFQSWTTTYYWIKWASFWGVGTYRKQKRNDMASSIKEYAERHADYLAYQVNYQTLKQINATAKRNRLKPSFDFTYLYYKQKLRYLLKRPPMEEYHKKDIRSSKNSFYFIFLKYVSGITLVLKKNDTF